MRKNLSMVVAGFAGVVFLGALGLIAANGQKKADPAVIIPDAKKVALIRFYANGIFPDGPYNKKREFEVEVNKEKQVKPILGWLNGLDWDRSKAENIKRLRIVADLIITATIEIKHKDKISQLFEIGPGHIMQGDYRWKIDNKKLKKLDAIVQALR
jgi:hypothetical protein